MTQVCYIILEYLSVLIVDVWTSKHFVNWFNLLAEAMNGLMSAIVENIDIHYHIILLVILDINWLWLKLYEVGKLTYFLLYIWIVLFVIFCSSRTKPCMQNCNCLIKDASHNTYCYYEFFICFRITKKSIENIWIYEMNIYDYIAWIYELNIY